MTRTLLAALLLLLPAIATAAEPAVTVLKAGDAVEFKAGDVVVARYHVGESVAKPYLWPLIAPNGTPLTRDWPMVKDLKSPKSTTDHVHQKSAWFCHGDIIPEGVPLKYKIKHVEGVDFWAELEGHGKIVCEAVDEPKGDTLSSRNVWKTADGLKVLSETRTVRLVPLEGARLFIVESVLTADAAPLTFGDTKEGAFGVRVRDELATATGSGTITNADGKVGEKECWGMASKWCDYSGPLDGKTAGITILDHPENVAPACWHVRGYGLMAANPFGREKSGFPSQKGKTELVKLSKGEKLRLVYGLLLHDGDVKSGKVADRYEDFLRLTAKK